MENNSDLHILDNGRLDLLTAFMGLAFLTVGIWVPFKGFDLQVVGLFTLPFVLAGVFLLFRRAGMWIDKSQGVLVSWSRFPSFSGGRLSYPKTVNSTPLEKFDRLEVRRFSRNSDSGYKFAVDLIGPESVEGTQYWTSGKRGPENGATLAQYRKAADAEKRALFLSEYLGLPITRCQHTKAALESSAN